MTWYPGSNEWGGRLVAGIGALLAIGGVVLFFWLKWQQGEAAYWHNVTGQVERTEIKVRTSQHARRANRTSYAPVVHYRYEVQGQTHRNDRTLLNDAISFDAPAEAEAFLADYPVGRDVRVSYNPDNPAQSALVTSGNYWPVLLGLPFGLLLIWFGRQAQVSPWIGRTGPSR